MKSTVAISILLLLIAGCSNKKSVAPEVTTYSLTGRVINQFGSAVAGLRVKATGANSHTSSTTTDSIGVYNIEAPQGAATISFSSTETVIYNLPRYISRDTLITGDSGTVVDMTVREFTTVFHDAANRPSSWDMYGGVSNDGAKYIFQDLNQSSDHMMMTHTYPIPDTLQHVGFILYGQAAPTNTSDIIVNAWVDGAVFNGHWTATFSTTPSYYHGAMDTVPGIRGGALQLDLIFSEVDATYIYIRDIWIYCY